MFPLITFWDTGTLRLSAFAQIQSLTGIFQLHWKSKISNVHKGCPGNNALLFNLCLLYIIFWWSDHKDFFSTPIIPLNHGGYTHTIWGFDNQKLRYGKHKISNTRCSKNCITAALQTYNEWTQVRPCLFPGGLVSFSFNSSIMRTELRLLFV